MPTIEPVALQEPEAYQVILPFFSIYSGDCRGEISRPSKPWSTLHWVWSPRTSQPRYDIFFQCHWGKFCFCHSGCVSLVTLLSSDEEEKKRRIRPCALTNMYPRLVEKLAVRTTERPSLPKQKSLSFVLPLRYEAIAQAARQPRQYSTSSTSVS